MYSDFLKTYLGSPPYSRIEQESPDQELLEKGDIRHSSSSKQSQCRYLVLSTIFIALASVSGYILGSLNHHADCESAYFADTVNNSKRSTYQDLM